MWNRYVHEPLRRGAPGYRVRTMGPWLIWLWRLMRNRRFRAWLLATAGPRALALFVLWLDRLRHRQIAIEEADQIDGLFSGAIIDGQRHVIVWKDGEPVSAYPPVAGDLAVKLKAHTRRGLTHPDELPTRRARRWMEAQARRVGDAAGRARQGAASARRGAAHGAASVGEQARHAGHALGEQARQTGHALGEQTKRLPLPKRTGRGDRDDVS